MMVVLGAHDTARGDRAMIDLSHISHVKGGDRAIIDLSYALLIN